MAILKQRLSRKNVAGGYDPVYLETSSDLVLRPDGTTAEASIAAIMDEIQNMGSGNVIPDDLIVNRSISINHKFGTPIGEGSVAIGIIGANGSPDADTDDDRRQIVAGKGSVGIGKSNEVYSGASLAVGFSNIVGHQGCTDNSFYNGSIVAGWSNVDEDGSQNAIFGDHNTIFGAGQAIVVGERNYVGGRGESLISGSGNMTISLRDGVCIGEANLIDGARPAKYIFKLLPDENTVVSSDETNGTTLKLYVDAQAMKDHDCGSVMGDNVSYAFNEISKTGLDNFVIFFKNPERGSSTKWTSGSSSTFYRIDATITELDKTSKTITIHFDKQQYESIGPNYGYIVLFMYPKASGRGNGSMNFTIGSANYNSGELSHIIGTNCACIRDYQLICGYGAIPSKLDTDRIVVGNGQPIAGLGGSGGADGYAHDTYDFANQYTARSNCFRVTNTGVYAAGNYNASGADYAEMFEWLDSNPDNEDRAGMFVTLDGDKLRLAKTADDFILGVVSGNPSIIGDVHDDQWKGMYMYDIFGRPIFETVEIPEYTETVLDDPTDENSSTHEITHPARSITRQKLNPEYNAGEEYISRSSRPEWAAVGMMGKLVVIDDGTSKINGYVSVTDNSIATYSETKTKFRVMKRLDDTHIQILVLP